MREEKHRQIVEALRKDISDGRYGAGRPFPSERALARRFGVSRPTVTMALRELRGKGLVVQEVGRGTFLTRKAKALAGSIGLLLPDLHCGEIFPPISRELSRLAQASGFTLLYGDASSEDPSVRARLAGELAQKFIETPVKGVIYKPLEFLTDMERINREIVSAFDRAKIPVVLLDWDFVASPGRSAYDVVGVNNFDIGRTLARHMLERGARHVRVLRRPLCATTVMNRILGVQTVLGAPRIEDFTVTAEPSDETAIRRALRGRKGADAFICGNDAVASHLLVTLRRIGKRVPEDVLVAGVDDVEHATLVTPPLTTIHQPCEAIAATAFHFLLSRIDDPSLPARECLLPAPLVVRSSTASRPPKLGLT